MDDNLKPDPYRDTNLLIKGIEALEQSRQLLLKTKREKGGFASVREDLVGTRFDGLDDACLEEFCRADTVQKKVAWMLKNNLI
jgi:hypothetical protein